MMHLLTRRPAWLGVAFLGLGVLRLLFGNGVLG